MYKLNGQPERLNARLQAYYDSMSSLPTANHSGPIELILLVNGEKVTGPTVPTFLVAVLQYIERHGQADKINTPVTTTGQNYLLAKHPRHPSGYRFATFEQVKLAGQTLYLNTNHPRFFGLRMGIKLFLAAGIEPIVP